ncbi:MAG: glycosyltransferase [Desulfuromonadaceae bacterium]|nr:glycosyltransferase [Desulfuromonadaceae bacterium]
MMVSWVKTDSSRRKVLGVFAREPLPGRVKTRLSPPLSAIEAAEFYRLSLQETVDRMSLAGFDPVIFFAGGKDYFRQAFPALLLVEQREGDLGARLDQALAEGFAAGAEALVLIGSDSPDIPVRLVEEAFESLSEAEAVVAPAVDGGYVLIGERRHCPALFREVPWGGARVMEVTRNIARREKVRLAELAEWDDVDDWPSLVRFLRRSPGLASARYVGGLKSVMAREE